MSAHFATREMADAAAAASERRTTTPHYVVEHPDDPLEHLRFQVFTATARFASEPHARRAHVAMSRRDKHCRRIFGPEPGRLPYRIAEVWPERKAA